MIYKLPQEHLRRIVNSTSVELSFSILFYHSTISDFANYITKTTQKKFPFFYVNTMGMTITDNICTIPDIVIATLSDSSWDSKTRDERNFKPFLIPIMKEVMRRLEFDNHLTLFKEGTTHFHYLYGKEGLTGHEAVIFEKNTDAIQLKNFKFRISKN